MSKIRILSDGDRVVLEMLDNDGRSYDQWRLNRAGALAFAADICKAAKLLPEDTQ